jgi:hypothetical protein
MTNTTKLAAAPVPPIPAPAPQPTTSVPHVASIDTPEFRKLLHAVKHGAHDYWPEKLIAHIDGHIARQAQAASVSEAVKQELSRLEDLAGSGGITAAQLFTKMRWLVTNCATPAAAQAAPTDLSKRLRNWDINSVATIVASDLHAAADEIERYYGGMLSWKRTAEAKDREPADAQATPAAVRDAALLDRLDQWRKWESSDGSYWASLHLNLHKPVREQLGDVLDKAEAKYALRSPADDSQKGNQP